MYSECPCHKPILFLIFNRPELTRRVFSEIRKASPTRLYIAADGPRTESSSDHVLCAEARDVVARVDWPCEVYTLFRDENLGCGRAVSGAIDWFFENEEAGIILEDDCLPDTTWFHFAEEMLERYADDSRVFCISATHFPGKAHVPEHSYYFSIYNHCWGWASWRRAWNCYDFDMEQWPRLKHTDWLLQLGNGSRSFKRYWSSVFDRIYAREIDTWDYYWTYAVWTQRGLTILPSKNLVVNLGFGSDATHTKADVSSTVGMNLQSMTFPLMHPAKVAVDKQADNWTTRNHFKISAYALAKKKIADLPLFGPVIVKIARWRRG